MMIFSFTPPVHFDTFIFRAIDYFHALIVIIFSMLSFSYASSFIFIRFHYFLIIYATLADAILRQRSDAPSDAARYMLIDAMF